MNFEEYRVKWTLTGKKELRYLFNYARMTNMLLDALENPKKELSSVNPFCVNF